jgi:hypothetical protein
MLVAGDTTDKRLMMQQDKQGRILTCIFRTNDKNWTTLIQGLVGCYNDSDRIYVS